MHDQSHGSFAVMVDMENAGKRLDAFVATLFPDISRNSIAERIRSGDITVHHLPKKPGFRLSPGDLVSGTITRQEPAAPSLVPELMTLSILFEDDDIIVLNKPPGIVVHPAPGHGQGTLAGGLLFHHPGIADVGGYAARPGIVHRLDKDTSGVLVAAKNDAAHSCLVRQFKERMVSKKYLGLVYGHMGTDGGRIILPIGRHATNRKKMGTNASASARYAETHWRLRRQFTRISFLEFDIKTGRTHQIRVHCAAMHHPIVGDPVYGFKRPGRLFVDSPLLQQLIRTVPRQMLHSWQLGIIHPETGEKLQFEAPLPEDMSRIIGQIAALET